MQKIKHAKTKPSAARLTSPTTTLDVLARLCGAALLHRLAVPAAAALAAIAVGAAANGDEGGGPASTFQEFLAQQPIPPGHSRYFIRDEGGFIRQFYILTPGKAVEHVLTFGSPLELDETTAPPGAAEDFAANVEAERIARQEAKEAAEAARQAAEEHDKKTRALWKAGRFDELADEDRERLDQEARLANHGRYATEFPEDYAAWINQMQVVQRFMKERKNFWTYKSFWRLVPTVSKPSDALDSHSAKIAYRHWTEVMSAADRKQWEADYRDAHRLARRNGWSAEEKRRKLDELMEIVPGQKLPAWTAAGTDSASEGEAAAASAPAAAGPQADQASQPKHSSTPAHITQELERARKREAEEAIVSYFYGSIVTPAVKEAEKKLKEAQAAAKASRQVSKVEAHAQAILEGRVDATAAERKDAEVTHAKRVQREIAAQEAEARAREALASRRAESTARPPESEAVWKKARELANEKEKKVMAWTNRIPDKLLHVARTSLGLSPRPAEAATGSDGDPQPISARSAERELLRARRLELERAVTTPGGSSYVSAEGAAAQEHGRAPAVQEADEALQKAYAATKASRQASKEEARALAILEGRVDATAAERKKAEVTHAERVQREIAAQEAEARAREAAKAALHAEIARNAPVLIQAWKMGNEAEREAMMRTKMVPDKLLAAARAALGLSPSPTPEGGGSATGSSSTQPSSGGESGASGSTSQPTAPAGNGNTGEAAEGACAC